MKVNGEAMYRYHTEPSRNFNILGSTTVLDPLDGREKLVLSNFAAGATGSIILIDTETGDGEAILLPDDNGAWAVLNLRDERLLVGTCAQSGYLHSLDLKTRTWAEPLRDPEESYIWELVLGSDGLVYGCTYPGCRLLRYHPDSHVLENVGRVSDNPKNLYSRHLDAGVPGRILISGGMDTHFVTAYDLKTGSYRQVVESTDRVMVSGSTDRYIRVETADGVEWYDPSTYEPIPVDAADQPKGILRTHSLSDGKMAGVKGQDYYVQHPNQQKLHLQRIPTPAPATDIHTLVSDSQGIIWGASAFGQTIFRYEPDRGDLWNSSVVTNTGGEVYGMCFVDGRLFMSAYSGGDHIVYDPSADWDQLNNVNPRTLQSVRPALIRPTGRSVVGPDGAIWTGWSAKYGVYGGGLSRIDPETLDVTSCYDPSGGEQQIAGLAADERYLYFTTNGGASGLAYKDEPCRFVVWSVDGSVVWQHTYDQGIRLEAILAIDGKVLLRVEDELHVFDPATLRFEAVLQAGQPCTWLVAVDGHTAGAFCGQDYYYVDMRSLSLRHIAKLPGTVHAAAVTPQGDVYFACGTKLYQML